MGKAAWRSLHSGGLIIASTPYIAEQVGPLETPTVVLPTCIDTAAWAPIPAEDVTDGPVLGWSGTISSRRPDLGILRGWLGPFMDEHDLRIIHAGFIEGLDKSGDFARAADIDPDRVMTRTFVPPTACPTSGLMDGVDIGLVPMADRMVSKAKTALKGMEYSARGIPSWPARSTHTGRWTPAGSPVPRSPISRLPPGRPSSSAFWIPPRGYGGCSDERNVGHPPSWCGLGIGTHGGGQVIDDSYSRVADARPTGPGRRRQRASSVMARSGGL